MDKDVSVEILSDITVYMKYARYLEDKNRRETWKEIVDRNKQMHQETFPNLFDEIEDAYKFVYDKKVLPSMRSAQFAGKPIHVNPSRIYNCSYLPVDHPDAFSETMFLLLGGTGVGYSVQKQHVKKLPPVLGIVHPTGKKRKKRYLISDSIEGWADSIKMLVESYFYGKQEIDFDFSDIRPKGAKLITSGGKAPGPEPLRQVLVKIQSIFENAIQERGKGTYLKPIEAHDMMCLDSESRVYTENGYKKISDLVQNKSIEKVLSFNEETNLYEFKEIYNWYENEYDGDWFKIKFAKSREGKWGQLHAKFTPEHPILTESGYKEVAELVEGDKVISGEYDGDKTIKSIIIGSSLGDATIVKQGSSYFSVSHCESQKPYLDWKKTFFDNRGLVSQKNFIKRNREGIHAVCGHKVSCQNLFTFNSSSRFFIDDIYDELYHNGIKGDYSYRFLDENLTPLAIAVWFMDDGSNHYCAGGWNAPYNYATISVGILDDNSIKNLKNVLEEKYGISCTVDVLGKSKRIRFRKEESEKLFHLICKFVPKEMEYKLPEFFRGKYDFKDIVVNKPYVLSVEGVELVKPRKGKKSYCIDVKDNHNFLTFSGIVHNCHIADAVLAGGIRRAAMISLFSFDDNEMLTSKSGNWWETHPERGRANNSAVAVKTKIKKEDFDKFWEYVEASKSGEPGIFFTDDRDGDWGLNPSLMKGIKVWTTEGVYPIEELEGEEFFVRNLNGEISQAKCWKSGENKQLIKLSLAGGQDYFATPQHEWPVWDGEKFVKYRSDELENGMFLKIIKTDKLTEGTKGTYNDGFLMGWQMGDGWSGIRTSTGKRYNGLIVSEKDDEDNIKNRLIESLNEKGIFANFQQKGSSSELSTQNKNWDNFLDEFGYNGKEKLPSSVWKEASEEFRKGLIDGLFSSDGSVSNPEKKKSIVLTSSRENLIKEVKELLGFYGIKTSINYYKNGEFNSYNLRIQENASIQHFKKLFKFSVSHKQERLNAYETKQKTNFGEDLIKIENVELSNVCSDVWDISVKDKTHAFQLSGAITGNCAEISLRPFQFCNLTTINASNIIDQKDLEERAKAAAIIGTLQASYTDFHYLRDMWRDTTEKEALLGVSMTGIASGSVLNLDLKKAAKVVKDVNEYFSKKLGIRKAARTTAIKPEGTASLVLGTSSGIHGWWDPYYIRRIRVGKNEAIYNYLNMVHPELIEDEIFKPEIQSVISVPQKSPEGAILRHESPIDTLERVKKFNIEWVREGHRDGVNKNNVSCTINIKDDEWDIVGDWMWNNRDYYTAIAVLPYSGGTYKQAPFETTDENTYNEMMKHLSSIDLTQVFEEDDDTDLSGELACAGGACEVA